MSRSAIAANFEAVRALVGPQVEVAPVIKADAYRHGAIKVARILAPLGARWFCVSSVDEGIALREAGIDSRILVMADSLPDSLRRAVAHRLTPVLHDVAEIAKLDQAPEPVDYHLKIDSGMGRLGTRAGAANIAAAVAAARVARLDGLMTHFASAADYVSEQTGGQCEAFDRLVGELADRGVRPHWKHLSSTTAVAYGRREAWGNLVRPGHAIHGYVSQVRAGDAPPRNLLRVRPALAWKAAVLAVKELPAGAPVGYGAQFVTPRPMRIAVIAAGYADGIPHRLSNRGKVIAAGAWAPVLGAVSMDVTTIDASAAPGLRPGDSVTLIGREGAVSQDAQQLARAAGTISYDVLCGISARVERVFVD